VNLVFAYAPYIWPSIISSLLMLALAVFSFRHRDMPGAIPFAIACIFGLFWSIGSIIELTVVGIDLKIFWRKFQVVFQLPAATAITCFLLAYTWPKRWFTLRNLVLLWIVPIIMAVIVFTDHHHHLFWEGFDLNGALIANPGPLMKYFLAYVFLNFLFNIFIFIWLFIHSPQNRWPVVIMVIGQIIMRLLFFIDIANRGSSNLQIAPVGIAFTSLMYAIVFFRFRFLGPIPLARQAVINQMPIGMLVLDHQLKIVSLNPVAEKMLQISSQKVKNNYIGDVLDAYPQNLMGESDIRQLEFYLETGMKERHFLLDILWLKDWRDDHVGQLLLLTDVTEQRAANARILEQGRVMATMQEREQIAR
jgi:PAS domain-containing protein